MRRNLLSVKKFVARQRGGCDLAQVFEPKEWAALMGKSILPKLAYCLDSEFAVNPVDQQLEAWEWAMSWASVLPR